PPPEYRLDRSCARASTLAEGLASARLGEQASERTPSPDPARLRGLTMTVDQADDAAARTAVGGGRPRHAAALHPWPDASPAGHGPDAPAGGHAAGAVEPGLAGLWPAPHAGSPPTAREGWPA